MKHKMESRLPPGQRQVKDLPVLHIGAIPPFNPATWEFSVEGLVQTPLHFSWQEFLKLPRTQSASDFHCVTGWSRLDNVWEGVLFRDIARLAQPLPQAQAVTIECYGGYYTSLPLADLMGEDVILAYRLDGVDLAPKYGGPLRLVVPAKYAYKSAKWVRLLRFTAEQEPGYWEERGYSNTADPWTEDRTS